MMKKLAASFTALVLCVSLVACSTSWVNQAVAIANVALPATLNILQLAAVISGHPMNPVFAQTAQNDFKTSVQLFNDYKNAAASAQPGVLAQIQAQLAVTKQDLNIILPTIHVSDPVKQEQIQAMIGLVLDEVNALATLATPASPGMPTARLSKPPMSAKLFKKSFNEKIVVTGHTDLVIK